MGLLCGIAVIFRGVARKHKQLFPISKQEICYVLPDISPTTVEAALATLVKSGALEKIGAGRNTKYSKRQSLRSPHQT